MFMYTHIHKYTIRRTYSYTHILKQSGLSTLLSIYQGVHAKLTVCEISFHQVKMPYTCLIDSIYMVYGRDASSD